MPPRPILKAQLPDTDTDAPLTCPLPFASCSQSQFQPHSPHVHFPPTPRLARAGITHSPNTYDRAPIVVLPNDCEMPDRGGRSYDDGGEDGGEPVDEEDENGDRETATTALRKTVIIRHDVSEPERGLRRRSSNRIESYFHPRAFEACRLSVEDAEVSVRYPPSPAIPVVQDSLAEEESSTCTAAAVTTAGAGSSTFNALALTLLPCLPAAEKSPRKKRSTSRLRGSLRGAYTRSSTNPGGDPTSDGCLGGF